MSDLKDLELKPFKLADVPAGLAWCIYPEEQERGEVLLPETAYMVVLALRWILSCTSWGYEEDFETWRVYWRSDDKYGFSTRVILCRDKVEQYDYDDEPTVMQPQTWVELAKLHCSNGRGIVNEVFMPGAPPYGEHWRLDGAAGVRRLLEDAMTASQATHNYYPISRHGDWISTYRCDGMQEGDGHTLSLKLKCDGTYVKGVSLKVERPFWR